MTENCTTNTDLSGRSKKIRSRPRDGSQILRSAQQGIDALIRHQKDLESQNKQLLKTNRDLHTKLSDADDRTKVLESSERKLSDCIQEVIEERDTAIQRVKELEQIATTKRRITSPTNNEAKRVKRERNLKSIKRFLAQQETMPPPRPPLVSPSITIKMEEEQTDSYMTSDDEEESVPGLPLVEYGLNKDIIEQLTEVMGNPKRKRRLLSFLKHGERGKYFCAHKVFIKGRYALARSANTTSGSWFQKLIQGPNCTLLLTHQWINNGKGS